MTSTNTGELVIDLVDQFAGVADFYLDTLHSDYAFLVTPAFFVKSMELPSAVEVGLESGWDFALYPNPSHDELYLQFPDDVPRDIALYDLSGRRIQIWSGLTGPLQHLPVDQLAKGIYTVRVSDGTNSRTKKLIIH